jgi:hypothetical protein
VNSTMNALSMRTMPELLRRVLRWDEERRRMHREVPDLRGLTLVFNLLTGPPFMHAGIFGPGFFDAEFTELLDLLPRQNAWERGNVEYLRGIWRAVEAAPHDPALISQLKVTLDELDRRRRTDWRRTFPWLTEVS